MPISVCNFGMQLWRMSNGGVGEGSLFVYLNGVEHINQRFAPGLSVYIIVIKICLYLDDRWR